MKSFDILGEIWQMSDFYVRRHEETKNGDYPLKSTGEYAVDYPSPGVFQESKKLGLFSGFRIGGDFWPRRFKLEALNPETELVQIDLLRSTTDFKRPENQALEIGYDEFAEKYFNAAIDYSLEHPGRVMLCGVGEIDTSHPWPKDAYFRTREEAYEFFQKHCFHARIGSCDPESLYRCLKNRGLSLQQANFMIHGACIFAIPYYFEWGFPHVEIERGLGTSLNMQVSLAYLRGAWKQFGRRAKWGVDISTHQPNYNQCSWYDANGTRIGGFSESLILRQWMAVWFGGADYLLCEGSDYTHWVFQKDGSFRLSALGETARKFADFTLRSGIDRGEPIVPGAVLLDYKNGYEQEGGVATPHPYVWGNRLPYTSVDTNISCVFNAFFPGQQQVSRWSEKIGNPQCGYSTRQEYLAALKAGRDMRYLEKGFMTASPYGDSLDVLWDNAPAEVLREYRVLIPAGAVKLPENILEEYVAEGGTLAISEDRLTAEMEQKLGLNREKPLGSDWDYDRIAMTDGSFVSDGLRYGFVRFRFGDNVRVLAVNSRNIPIVLEITYGRGKVLLCTVPLGQDVSGGALIGVWAYCIGREVKKHLPVDFDAREQLELAVNRTEDGRLLLALFNATDRPWRGKLQFRENITGAVQVFPEKYMLELLNPGTVEAEVPPYSVKIIRADPDK